MNKGNYLLIIPALILLTSACKNMENYREPKERITYITRIQTEEIGKELEELMKQPGVSKEEIKNSLEYLEAECDIIQTFDNVVFEINRYEIKDSYKEEIRKQADKLMGKKGKLFIVGYTDDTGSDKINNPLSLNRAKTIEKIYREKLGSDIEYYTIGVGRLYPEFDNTSEQEKIHNRRVRVFFIEM